ncbi:MULTISPECIES: M4 family metallopeptidase [Streptomyces]|uniref:M4 family metallopeptidase n=1 Tax=Streptomyces TaxID=1883 RepID=UPI000F6FBF04|nr:MULTISPECIES: M4 family metallopeptidase [unclassified Streptomyces]AZM93399.1 M4 family peptidase [Streptomyces sp. W1SF4]RSS37667.1 M4 family peptidase [Streptomyces sp. WAC07061]
MSSTPTSRNRTRMLRTAAVVASAAMVAVAAQSGAASAAAEREAGATALTLSSAARTQAISAAQGEAAGTARAIGLSDEERLVARDVVKDADGTVHTRYERTYAGVPVLGGDLIVHQKKDGSRKTTKGTEARIAPAAARGLKPAPAGARQVVWAATGNPVFAYEAVVTGTQPDGTPSERHVITDAATGAELYAYEAIDTGTGTSGYSGTVPLATTQSGSAYSLTDGGRGGHKTYDLGGATSTATGTLFTDADDAWGDGTPANRQTAAVDAHYGAAVTWDFYKSELGRNGIAGDGKAAYSRVHYGNAYVNAFWSDSCFCMTYGDGANNKKPLTSLDVAGHEMSHGLTAATAKLNYSRESGGLNEATSDILGTSVEFFANNAADPGDYLIGEKIDIRGNGTPLRYMDKPSKDGASADYWSKTVGRLDVHNSSGVANHFFYLLSEGSGAKTVNGVSYDSPTYDGSTVTGIGRTKAYKIWYKALSTYMTSTTDYAGARTATLKATADLYGASGTEYQQVAAAWKAVNVN